MTTEPSADAAAPEHDDAWEPQDPWAAHDPWTTWRTGNSDEGETRPPDENHGADVNAADGHRDGTTVHPVDSGWGAGSTPANGEASVRGPTRWSPEAWQQWQMGTWRPEMGGQLEDGSGSTRRISVDTNQSSMTTSEGGRQNTMWGHGGWQHTWHGASWAARGHGAGAGAASTSTAAPSTPPGTRPGPSATAWTGTTSTNGPARTGGGHEGSGARGPSEKLLIPSFSGSGEGAELGTSARSYIRQIAAWERMTKLMPSQRALVLYQHLEGAAWVNAEALDVEKLSAEDGVDYLRAWVTQHYLDVEVTSVGRSLSDLFRKLRRRYNQTFRDYTAEFNRLLARVVECGCRLPDVATAWLYVDRASLDEATEVSLLASVGNKYQLAQLQQAAIILDRSMRKPWEKAGKDGTRRPQSVNLAEDAEAEGGSEIGDEEAPTTDDPDLDNGELYVAYMTAKARYKDSTRARGVDVEAVRKTAEERIKAAKQRSYCSACGQKGHWHKDPGCPGPPKRKPEVQTVHVAHEIDNLKASTEDHGLLAITDSACSKSVVGTAWYQAYLNMTKGRQREPEMISEREAFRFGASRIYESNFAAVIFIPLGGYWVAVKTAVIHGDVPLLISKPALAKLGTCLDLENDTADFRKLGISNVRLLTTPSGHPSVSVSHDDKVPPGPEVLKPWEPPGVQIFSATREVYMTVTAGEGFGESLAPRPSTEFSRIFFEKKLSPEAKNMLVDDALPHDTFLQWWHASSYDSDFWIETPEKLVRVHVTPRKYYFDPSKWQTTNSLQRDMLLQVLGSLRESWGIACGSQRPLSTVCHQWQDHVGTGYPAGYPTLWIGRSVFNREHPATLCPRLVRDVVPPSRDMEDVEDRAAGRVREAGHTHNAPVDSPREQPTLPKGLTSMSRDELVNEAGTGTDDRVTRDQGGDHSTDPGRRGPGPDDHDHRPLQGLELHRDTGELRQMGLRRGEGQWEQHAPRDEAVRGVATSAPTARTDPSRPEDQGPGLHEGRDRGSDPTATYERDRSIGVLGLVSGAGERGHSVEDRPDGTLGPQDEGEANHTTAPGGGEQRRHSDGEGADLGDARGDQSAGGTTCVPEGRGGAPAPELERRPRAQRGVDHGGVLRGGRRPPEHYVYVTDNPGELRDGTKDVGREEIASDEEYESCPSDDQGANGSVPLATSAEVYACRDTGSLNKKSEHPGELAAQAGVKESSYDDRTLERILSLYDIKDRNKRPGVHHEGDNRSVLGYYAFGKFHGVTKKTMEWPNLARYLNKFFLERKGGHHDYSWTSLSITRNSPAGIHTDRNNMPGSRNLMWTGGDHSGGKLWIADEKGTVPRREEDDIYIYGMHVDPKGRIVEFDPKQKHASETWSGERWSVVAYVARSIPHASKSAKNTLKDVGFPVPTAGDLKDYKRRNHLDNKSTTEGQRRPRRSMRQSLWKNVAAICVMMATATSVMDLYVRENIMPRREPNVAILEVGDVRATCTVVGHCENYLDVAEPLLYEDLANADQLEEMGVGPVETATLRHEPGELWVHVTKDWEDERVYRDIEEAADHQLRGGRAVVFQRGGGDHHCWARATAGWKEAGYTVNYDFDHEGIEYLRVAVPEETDQCNGTVAATTESVYVGEAVQGEDQPPERRAPPDGAKSIRFPTSVPKHIATSLRRLHQNLGHPSEADFVRHLRLAGASREVLKAARTLECQTCARTKATAIAKPAKIGSCLSFNEVVGVDLLVFYVHDTEGHKHELLSIVDYSSAYHVVVPVAKKDTWHLERAFCQGWGNHFGVPQVATVDLENGLQKSLARVGDWSGMQLKSAAGQAHWQAGFAERQGGIWKSVFHRVNEEMSVTKAEIHLAVQAVSQAKNDLIRANGYSPRQHVFGATARLLARKKAAFHHVQTDDRVRRALAGRARVLHRRPEVGEQVFFFRHLKNSKRGVWKGPGTVIGEEGANFWITKAGRCVLCAPEHIRLATAEELGQAFTMRAAREDLERLLAKEIDDDEAFAEDMEVDAVEEEMDYDLEDNDDILAEEMGVQLAMEEDELQPSRGSRRSLEGPRASILKRRRQKGPPTEGEAAVPPQEAHMLRRAKTERLDPDLATGNIHRQPHREPRLTYPSPTTRGLMGLAAFLNGLAIGRDLYMEQPRGGVEGLDPAQLLKIKKGVFGLAESPRMWYDRLREVLSQEDFMIDGVVHKLVPCPLDPCVFCLQTVDDPKPKGYIAIHVDDLLIIAPPKVAADLKEKISLLFPVDDWETDDFDYIGSRITKKDGKITVHQTAFVEGRLFNIDVPKDQPADEPATEEQGIDNRSLIGALSWLSSQTRPDLQCSVALAQQLQKAPTTQDVRFTNTVAQRAAACKDKGLTLHPIKLEDATLVIYHDAAWANAEHEESEEGFRLTPEEIRQGEMGYDLYTPERPRQPKRNRSKLASQLGYLICLGEQKLVRGERSPLSILEWRSQACQRVCRSTFGAETMSAVEAMEAGQYLRALLATLVKGPLVRLAQARYFCPLLSLTDCKSVHDHLHRAGQPRIPADRRLGIDLAALRQDLQAEVPNGESKQTGIPLRWIPTEIQLADILTKPKKGEPWWSMMDEGRAATAAIKAQECILLLREKAVPWPSS
ncbi:GIP [Symbiodinium sp. CCMP2592]|nr:GIP [Symbiodinium sp. CCMP2592]